MTTEPTRDELRQAAKEILEGHLIEVRADYTIRRTYPESWQALARHVLATLDAAEAEKVERALPITREWLESIGGKFGHVSGRCYLGDGKVEFEDDGWVYVCNSLGGRIGVNYRCEKWTTRGAVLDLLAALGVNTKGAS